MSLRPVALALILSTPFWLAHRAPGEPEIPPAKAGTDRRGDPLPRNALARMGTIRFRHGGPVAALVISPDGKRLASAGGDFIHVWDVATGREVYRLRSDWVSALAFSRDGKTLAWATGIGTIHRWDTTAGKELRHFGQGDQGKVNALAFSPSGTLLASASADRSVRLWQVATGQEARRLTGHNRQIVALAFAAQGSVLAGAGQGVFLWEPASGKFLGQRGGQGLTRAVSFSPDGNRVAAAGDNPLIQVWERSSGKEQFQVPGQPNQIGRVALAAAGKTAAFLDRNHAVHQWDLESGKELRKVPLESAGSTGMLALAPDGTFLAAVEEGHTIRLWDLENGKERVPTLGHRGDILSLVFSPNGKALTSGSKDGTLRSWEAASGKETRSWGKWSRTHRFLALSPDGKALAGQTEDGAITLWDVATEKERRLEASPASQPLTAAFSEDGSLLAVGYQNRPIHLWRLTQTDGPIRLAGHSQGVSVLAFSPDHQLLASAGPDDIRLWEVSTGKELAQWKTSCAHTLLVFSPDGALLATDNKDGIIALLDVVTGKELRQLHGHADAVHALAFSADGRLLASGGADPYVRVWELVSGLEIRRFQGHAGPVTAVAFAPDGRTLGSGSRDTSLLIWDLPGQTREGQGPVSRLGPEQLEALWKQLAGQDSSRAYDAVWSLAGHPRESMPFLLKRLELLLGVAPQRIDQLLAELDDDKFDVRERATADLMRLGKWAEPALRKHLTSSPSLEVQRRIEKILAKSQGGVDWTQERLRVFRSIEILEKIGSPAARECLEKLIQQAPEEELRHHARAALGRLDRRK